MTLPEGKGGQAIDYYSSVVLANHQNIRTQHLFEYLICRQSAAPSPIAGAKALGAGALWRKEREVAAPAAIRLWRRPQKGEVLLST